MTNPYRAMCAELVDSVELLLEMRAVDAKPMAVTEDRVSRARDLLAQPVAEGPTDEELWAAGNDDFRANCYPTDAIAYARAVLDRWGRPTPQPPTDGEVTELVEWLQSMRDLAGEHNPDEQRRYTRAAELLERLASDNAGLTAAADSLWADNVSLLDN